MNARKHSQYTQAVWMLRRLTVFDNAKTDALFREFEELLDRAQNPPPHGEADGTIDEPMFAAIRELVESSKRYRTALKAVLEIAWKNLRDQRPNGA